MKTETLTKIIQLCCALGVLTAASLQAAPITYDYTGNPFASATSPYTTSDFVSATVELASPLGDNFAGVVTPMAFSLSDGVQTLTGSNATFFAFNFTTGPSGGITAWQVDAQGPTNASLTGNISTSLISLPIAQDLGSTSEFASGSNFDNPGEWSVEAVPEPSTTAGSILLVCFIGMQVFRRFATRHASA